jgi:hypothetical protein
MFPPWAPFFTNHEVDAAHGLRSGKARLRPRIDSHGPAVQSEDLSKLLSNTV